MVGAVLVVVSVMISSRTRSRRSTVRDLDGERRSYAPGESGLSFQ